MKQYYQLYDTTFHTSKYYAGDSLKAEWLTKLGMMIIPLGNKKPRNVSRETIKTF